MSIDNKNDEFDVLRKIQKYPNFSQRKLAKELGFSLGKVNYCLNALIEKGLVKISNFNRNTKKMSYIYLLTPKGISLKTKLTISFMIKKINEYKELKKELDQ